MNRRVLQSSPVEQIMASGNPNWWSINNNSYPLPGPVAWSNNGSLDQVPEPWSQLLLVKTGHFEAKMLEDWEDQVAALDRHHQVVSNANNSVVDVKREGSPHSSYVSEEFNNMAGFFTTNTKADLRHPPPDRSSDKCSSNGNGGALKKARVHSSSNQIPSCKVRKEKLGDRVTALHQLVSPFGKTDTASVLLEAMGYIRFLQNQIEALSLPYFGSGSSNMRQQHSVHGEGSCLFHQDPGQEHEQGPKRDLMSRGLCLVPVSRTLQVGSDNVIDYWAPALGGAFR